MANITVPGERAAGAIGSGHRTSLWQRIRRNMWGYIFVSPWIILYIVFGLYPLVLSFYLTFFNYSFVTPETRAFVGVGNWFQGIVDPLFWRSLFNIVYNQAIFIVLKNGFGLLTAVLVFRARWGGRFFRTVYFLSLIHI